MNLYVGTSGYSYKEWKGKFYPKDLPVRKMLHYYGEHFRAVENNGTFRRLPTASAIEAWTADVSKDFKFVLKAPQQITHRKRLKDAGDSVKQLLETAAVLGERLGPLFFQLPPNFKNNLPRLRGFLSLLPPKSPSAFEFRHPSWFTEEVFDLLRSYKAALCIADADDDLKVPFEATADWGYLRLRRAEYSDAELKKWVKQVKKQDWREAYVFFKHEDEAKGPAFAARFLKLAK